MPTETRNGPLWYHDRYLVDGLATALTNAEVFSEASDVTAFLGKPQKYNDYYEVWAEANFPTNEDDDGWEEFAEAVSNEDDTTETD